MNTTTKIFFIFLAVFISIAAADTGSSTTYRLAVQENSFNAVSNSTTYSFAADSGSVGIGNSSSYRTYLGYTPFLAKFERPAEQQALINFTSLAAESVVYQSTTARFQITVKNAGSVNSTIVPRLYVYNSAGALVFQRTGTSTTLEAGATVSLLQYSTLVFSVGTTAAGTYNATANILYTDQSNQTNVTQNRSVLFEIRAVSTTSSSSSSSGGTVQFVPEVGPEEEIGPEAPEETEEAFIEFVSVPMLVEAENGETRDEIISISNPTGNRITSLTISAEGVPDSWISISDPIIDIEPGGQREIALTIAVPDNAAPGNYIVRISTSNGEISQGSSFLLRVTRTLQLLAESGNAAQYVTIVKLAKTDARRKETHFTLTLRNKDVYAEKLSVTEMIDKSIAASSDEITFVTPPSRIIERDPVVEWTFANVATGEERNITYYVKKIVNRTRAFISTSVEDVTLVTGLSPTRALELKIDYASLNTVLVLALAVAGLVLMYKLEHRIKRKIYAKGIQRFIGKPTLTAETGLKLGMVEDVTFMPATGELLDIVVKKPTPYARRLLVKRGTKNRLYIPFQSVKAAGDYIVITEKDIVFEAVLTKRPGEEQTRVNQFYKPSGTIKARPSDTITQPVARPKEKPPQYISAYGGFTMYSTKKPASVKEHLRELKKLYREGVIDKKTYRSARERLLEGLGIVKAGESEGIVEKIKNRIPL